MTLRAASDQTVTILAAPAAALVLLLALGSGWSSAHPVQLGGAIPREVNLLKPPYEDLRIRWSAKVYEEGGEFLVSRQGIGGSSSVVARVGLRGDGRYEVAEHGTTGSWVYSLRYLDRRGRMQVLATIRLNVECVDAGRGILAPGADVQPVAVRTASALPVPAAGAVLPLGWTEADPVSPTQRPPTPPP